MTGDGDEDEYEYEEEDEEERWRSLIVSLHNTPVPLGILAPLLVPFYGRSFPPS
jgi:hypothetical protein